MPTPDPSAQIKQILENMDAEELESVFSELNLQFDQGQTREQMVAQVQEAVVEAMLSGRAPTLMAHVEQMFSSMDPEVLADRLLSEVAEQITPQRALELREQLAEHFGEKITETMVSMMDDAQFEEFKAILSGDPDQVGAEITALAARVPGLIQALAEQMTREYESLKLILQS